MKKSILNYIFGFAWIFGFLFLSKFIVQTFQINFPASIIGMLLITFALQLKIIKLEWVANSANIFIKNMSLLFVPIAVGLIEHLELLKSAISSLILTCIFTTIFFIGLVGKTFELIENKNGNTK